MGAPQSIERARKTMTATDAHTRPPSASPGSADRPASGIGLVSVAASLAAGVVTLSLIIVNVALPAMSRDLDASLATIQWASTAFVLGLMTTVALTSWASARFGLKRLLLGALTVFMVASALSGIAWSIETLIVFRFITGLAGGILLPLAQAIVVRAARGVRLAAAMSTLNAPIIAVPVFGPVLGGLLIVGLGWRWVFFVCVVIAAIGLALSVRVLPHDEPEPSGPLDLGGLALISGALVLIVYGLSLLAHRSTETRALLMIGLGLLLTLIFGRYSRTRGPDALLDVSLFGKRSFLAPVTIAACFNFMLFGSAAIVPLYFESVRGESAILAGMLVGAQGVGSLVGMIASGRLSDRFGSRNVASIAAILALVGTLPWILLSPDSGYVALIVALIVYGAGLSAMMIAAYAVAYGTLEYRAVPGATSALNMVGRVSVAAGVALAIVVIQRQVPAVTRLGEPAAAAEAFSYAFVLFALVGIVALGAALMLPRQRGAPSLPSELI